MKNQSQTVYIISKLQKYPGGEKSDLPCPDSSNESRAVTVENHNFEPNPIQVWSNENWSNPNDEKWSENVDNEAEEITVTPIVALYDYVGSENDELTFKTGKNISTSETI